MTKSARHKTFVIFSLLVLSGLAARAGEIRLKSVALCSGSLVRLRDVAEIRECSAAQQAQLEAVELIVAPPSGRSRVIRQGELRELLTQRGIDVPTLLFGGADEVQIRTGRPDVAHRSAAREPSPPPAANVPHESSTGSASYVVPVRNIPRGEIVRAADIEVRSLAAARRGNNYVTRSEDIVGREATRPLDANQPIEPNALQHPVLVRRNETITVTSRAPGVHVRTSVRALEEGRYGETITVETLEKDKQKFMARVVDLRQADVYAGVEIVPATTAAVRSTVR